MEVLDSVLPVFVDYLGRFESEPGYVETSADIAREATTCIYDVLVGGVGEDVSNEVLNCLFRLIQWVCFVFC